MSIGCTGYLTKLHDPESMRATIAAILAKVHDFHPDAIAFRGVSGAAAAYPLSYVSGIPVLNVRKGKYCHGQDVEGPADGRAISRYVIVDDLISSGQTVDAIIDELVQKGIPASACVGIILYCNTGGRTSFNHEDGDNILQIPVVFAKVNHG